MIKHSNHFSFVVDEFSTYFAWSWTVSMWVDSALEERHPHHRMLPAYMCVNCLGRNCKGEQDGAYPCCRE